MPAGQTTYLTNYIVNPEFSVFWYAQDVNGFAGPSTYEVSGGASGNFFATIVDGDKSDMYPGMGKLWLQLPEAGDYQICQTVAPPKSQLANPALQANSQAPASQLAVPLAPLAQTTPQAPQLDTASRAASQPSFGLLLQSAFEAVQPRPSASNATISCSPTMRP